MTATHHAVALPSPIAATAGWTGRVLSGVIGGFLALEGLSRVVWGRALVAPSGTAPTLEPSLQLMVGLPLLLGAVLHLLAPTRLPGTLLALSGLAALLAVEAVADVRSPGHLLFWAYVAGLTLAAHILRARRA